MSEGLEKRLQEAEKEIERLNRQLEKAEKENAEQKRQLASVEKRVLEAVREIFGPYMTDEVLEDIVRRKGKVVIGGERRQVTMMFTDLRRSTELSEQMDPLQFIDMLNHYISEMIEIVNAWQGNILDFVGDAIVVVFGAPRINKDSARDAVAIVDDGEVDVGSTGKLDMQVGSRHARVAAPFGNRKAVEIGGEVDGPTELEHARLGVPDRGLLRTAIEQPGALGGKIGWRQKQVRQRIVSHCSPPRRYFW